MKFLSKEAQNLNNAPPFWTVLNGLAAFSWRHSVQEILSKWLPTIPLTTEMITLKIAKWIIACRNRFCWPCEWNHLNFRFFAFLPISSRTYWRHIHTAWLPRHFQNGDLGNCFSRDEFLQDSGYFKDWKFKGVLCLVDIGEDISVLEGPSTLIAKK